MIESMLCLREEEKHVNYLSFPPCRATPFPQQWMESTHRFSDRAMRNRYITSKDRIGEGRRWAA